MPTFRTTKLLHFCVFVALCNGHFFTSEQCASELERARHVLRAVAVQLVNEDHERQRAILTEFNSIKPSRRYVGGRFAASEKAASCPQPNATMFPPQATISSSMTAERTSKVIGRAASRKISVPSLFRIEANSDPYVTWINKLHDHLNRDEAVCNGPKFKGLHTVTNDQLWGFAALLLANHATALCPICDQMFGKLETMIFTPNRLLFSEEEEQLHRLVFARFPRTQTFCSAILPSCHKNYATRVARVSEGSECIKCGACMASLTSLQHRFLLDKKAVKDALAWLNTSFIHNICAELCITFPPNSPSPGGFFPNGVDYTECVAFSNDAFMFAVNAAKNLLKPEYFCSVEMGWCELNETPNIVHCLRQLCDEGLPVQLGSTLCKVIPDEPISAKRLVSAARYQSKLSRTNQKSQKAHYKSEL
uniref:Saposin B-type domain-containing protein n=1 Tax=Parascaris univalens TaxID=6257 RepID=A0A915B2X4_PARUN